MDIDYSSIVSKIGWQLQEGFWNVSLKRKAYLAYLGRNQYTVEDIKGKS